MFSEVVSFCLTSGRAIKHVKESIFTQEAGARRGIPKVLVVLTDGRSQDDVNKVSKEMQMEGSFFSSFVKVLRIINYPHSLLNSWRLYVLYVSFYHIEYWTL